MGMLARDDLEHDYSRLEILLQELEFKFPELLGYKFGLTKTSEGDEEKSGSSATKLSEDYLNHHQLEARIQNLFELVLKKQPEDPYRCMIEELHKIKSTTEESADMAAQSGLPLAPVPPTGPPPKNAR